MAALPAWGVKPAGGTIVYTLQDVCWFQVSSVSGKDVPHSAALV